MKNLLAIAGLLACMLSACILDGKDVALQGNTLEQVGFTMLDEKQYSCRVDSLGREYVGQYRPTVDLDLERVGRYMYMPEDQDVPFLQKEFFLLNMEEKTATPITCK